MKTVGGMTSDPIYSAVEIAKRSKVMQSLLIIFLRKYIRVRKYQADLYTLGRSRRITLRLLAWSSE